MKYGVVDIGSNSVRLMISDGVKSIYKKVKTTRLAENMCGANLQIAPMERTADAVSFFVNEARALNVAFVYVFATAAVRQAVNKNQFTQMVKERTGIDVDVIDGNVEAQIGIKGALSGLDGAVIDVGGASTEVIVVSCGRQVYAKSLDVGAVKLCNEFGQDGKAVEKFIAQKVKEYGDVPLSKFHGIGGTATCIASILQELEPYDPEKVDGYVVDVLTLEKLKDKLFSLSVEQRCNLKGLHPDRAKVIAGGCALLCAVAKYVGANQIIVSEKDNLEGYLMQKLEGK